MDSMNEDAFKHKGKTYLNIVYDGTTGEEGVTVIEIYKDAAKTNLIKEDKIKGRIGHATKEDFKYIFPIKD